MIKCSGCGATIQNSDPNEKGYVDKKVLEKKVDGFYCKRCFDLRHYNRSFEYQLDSDKYKNNIEYIKNDRGLIVNVVDFLDLDGSLITRINDMFDTSRILFVVNKVDVLLNSINKNKLKENINNYLKEKKIRVKDILLVSSFNVKDIELLIEKILHLHEELNIRSKNVFFIGMSNVGKSSIINQIIKICTNEENLITVSNSINTTLDNIYIPYNKRITFVDTPGIINKYNLLYSLTQKDYDYITPKSYIRPKTFQLKPLQTLFIMGFVRIDFLEGEKSTFITNFKNDLLIHRTKYENADEFYNNHLDDILKLPNNEERQKLGKIINRRINIMKDDKIDLTIGGLGYVTICGEGSVEIKHFERIKINIRKTLI